MILYQKLSSKLYNKKIELKKEAEIPKSTSTNWIHWKIVFLKYHVIVIRVSQGILLNNRNVPVYAVRNFPREAVIFSLLLFLLIVVSSQCASLGIS